MAAGELEQALLDGAAAHVSRHLSRLTRRLAEALLDSFRHQGSSYGNTHVEVALRLLREIGGADLPDALDVVVPEGYAVYGLYPETYLRAAARWREEGAGVARVIGIRSIGTSLGAAVAAASGAELAVSVRPGGHPFARTLDLGDRDDRDDRLGRELLAGADRGDIRFAVVDEGPGLSGSSFGAVADWLEDRGVPAEAIAFFPSHAGEPGPYASARHRERWRRARRCHCDFAELFVAPGSPWPLARWVEDLTGPAAGAPRDLGAGRWRELLYPPGAERPPAHLQQERRKYLVTSGGRRWLLKFAGLGRYGEEKLALAAALAAAGLAPPVAGLRHGFLVGPWLDGARPLPLAPEVDREALLDRVARYVAFRAASWPADPSLGASPAELQEMLEWNAGQALGEAAAPLRAWRQHLPELTALARPVHTDNRMHAWEWLVTPEGEILKTDALDHGAGNDLVGAQDPAWDLAGAVVELALDERERRRLVELAAQRGLNATPRQLAFYTAAYLAFQLGRCALAAQALDSTDPAEAAALRRAGEGYARRLGGVPLS